MLVASKISRNMSSLKKEGKLPDNKTSHDHDTTKVDLSALFKAANAPPPPPEHLAVEKTFATSATGKHYEIKMQRR